MLWMKVKVKMKLLSCVRLFVTPWTVAYQVPGFSRQQYWSGLSFPSPGDLPDPEIKSRTSLDMTLANIFFQSVACLVILLTLSVTEQKFFSNFNEVQLISSFSQGLCPCALGVLSQKRLSPYPRSLRFSLKFSSRSSIVLHFTFSSMIYLELILVKCIRLVSRFICIFSNLSIILITIFLAIALSTLSWLLHDPLNLVLAKLIFHTVTRVIYSTSESYHMTVCSLLCLPRWLRSTGTVSSQEKIPHVQVRSEGCEEIPQVQGKEQWLHFAGASMKRYPTSKVRETPVR